MAEGKIYVLYDGRAKSGDTSRAAVLVSASSLYEARNDHRDFAHVDGVWFEYDTDGGELINERICKELMP